MAKRKRLTPPQGLFMEQARTDPPVQPAPARSAPIADVAAEASATAALDEMADVLRQAREEGRMVLALPLDSVKADYLVRDRIIFDSEGMETLKNSLRQRGQQTPIEVESLGGEQYGLISGWRRLQALKQLQKEDLSEDGAFDTVLALVRSPEQSADAYLAMVEENEIRVGLSFYERARIAAKAADSGVFETEQDALRGLYGAVPRAKRSKIKSFIRIVRALDGVLKHPEVISEKFGLSLSRALDEDPSLGARWRANLREGGASGQITDAPSELAALQKILSERDARGDGTKTDSIQAKSAPDAPSNSGVILRANSDGSVTLHGPSVNAGFKARLKKWLAEQGS